MLIPVAHLEWVEWTTKPPTPKGEGKITEYNKTARSLPGRFVFRDTFVFR